MPKVNFYILNEANLESSFIVACRLLDKAYQQKQAVYIHLATEAEAKMLDDLLWTFRDDAFIPHYIINEKSEPNTLIALGYQQEPKEPYNILLNLTTNIPVFYKNYNRIIEFVPKDSKEIAREKFRQYRENNCELTTHDLSKA